MNHQEWYYRIYQEWIHTIENGGYVFFDTLTYNDENLPHLSDFLDDVPLELDFPCFSRDDIRGFLTRLNSKLKYDYGVQSSDYHRFLVSEYGTDEDATHRPHYHILFFITFDVDPFEFAEVVRSCWNKGFTDYVRLYGNRANVFRSSSKRSQLAVSNYVAKYVQKSSLFQVELDKRLSNLLLSWLTERSVSLIPLETRVDIDNIEHVFVTRIGEYDYELPYHLSQHYKKRQRDLLRLINQFHLQSKHFGECALENIDIQEVIKDFTLKMPDCKHFVRSIPLPLYYKRKIFYELLNINGFRFWVLNDLGKRFKILKDANLVERLAVKYKNIVDTFNLGISVDFRLLAKYVVYYRGRNNGNSAEFVQIDDLLKLPSNLRVFNYSTPSDKELFHGCYVSREFVGCQGEYYSHVLDDAVSFPGFLRNHVIDDNFLSCFNGFDRILDIISYTVYKRGVEKQNRFNYNQDYHNRVKAERRHRLSRAL